MEEYQQKFSCGVFVKYITDDYVSRHANHKIYALLEKIYLNHRLGGVNYDQIMRTYLKAL